MNLNVGDVNTWHEILTIVFVSLIVALPSVLSVRNHRELRKLDGQVSNGHGASPTLRDDVDEIRDTLGHIRHDLHLVRTEIADVRTDLNNERRERRDLEHRIEDMW